MTLRSKEAFLKAVWDWGIFAGCFGNTKISPRDVDGSVERHGHFLTLEAKPPKFQPGTADRIYWKKRVERDRDTVVVFYGSPPDDERDTKAEVKEMELWLPGGVVVPRQTADIADLREAVSEWFEKADSS